METLAELFALAWSILTVVWCLTFVRPTRRVMARAVLAPCHIPLRRARWSLAVLAITSFVTMGAFAPNTDPDKGTPETIAPMAVPSVAEQPAPASSSTAAEESNKDDLHCGWFGLDSCDHGLVPHGRWVIV